MPNAPKSETYVVIKNPCTKCEGSGSIRKHACPKCAGSGLVAHDVPIAQFQSLLIAGK